MKGGVAYEVRSLCSEGECADRGFLKVDINIYVLKGALDYGDWKILSDLAGDWFGPRGDAGGDGRGFALWWLVAVERLPAGYGDRRQQFRGKLPERLHGPRLPAGRPVVGLFRWRPDHLLGRRHGIEMLRSRSVRRADLQRQ